MNARAEAEVVADAADLARTERARKLFAGPVRFVLTAPALRDLPEAGPPEIALAGRSNVGKSSLLNAITGRKTLARASVTPGRTQALNVFDVGGDEDGGGVVLRLVDMPGYGFAAAPPKVVVAWRRLIGAYLSTRPTLARVLLLIDARHGFKLPDLEVMRAFDTAAVSYRVVLTKADKLPATVLAATLAKVTAEARTHPAAHPEIIVTAAPKGLGITTLRTAILADAGG